MTGYLYQVRYALLLLLRAREESELSIETLDDITFEDKGDPTELLQLKHHAARGSLTNSSADLWKTLRIWATAAHDGTIDLQSTVLTLVTTATAPEGSIPAMLTSGKMRDTGVACEALRTVANESDNKDLQICFEAFLGLSPEQQAALVASTYVLTAAPDLADVQGEVKQILRFSVRPEHAHLLYERLEGWWFGKVVLHLRESPHETMKGFELRDRVTTLAEQFRPEALPIDFAGAEPPEGVASAHDQRLFVRQLRMISVGDQRIENAMLDYYRAFQQRSRWAREDLLLGDELASYESRLVDAWQRRFLAMMDEPQGADIKEEELQRIGRQFYNWVEMEADIRIRPQVSEEYVMRGSYHLLADGRPPRVWWHPRLKERLAHLWQEATEGST
jgi:hypothetical protein